MMACSARRFDQPLEGVVVGQRQQLDAPFMGARNDCGRSQDAVRRSTVAVQINLHGAAFAGNDVCYYAATSRFWLPP